jgi:hypothetical protein
MKMVRQALLVGYRSIKICALLYMGVLRIFCSTLTSRSSLGKVEHRRHASPGPAFKSVRTRPPDRPLQADQDRFSPALFQRLYLWLRALARIRHLMGSRIGLGRNFRLIVKAFETMGVTFLVHYANE